MCANVGQRRIAGINTAILTVGQKCRMPLAKELPRIGSACSLTSKKLKSSPKYAAWI